MYVLKGAIDEEKVNLAIKRFINDWDTYKGELKLNTNRYATSNDLLNYFKEVTPDDLQYLITELFESVSELKTEE